MNNYVKIAGIVPELKLADIEFNKEKIIEKLNTVDADVYVFPELSLTGYTCQDLFLNIEFIEKVNLALSDIARFTNGKLAVVGAPIRFKNKLYNCAVYLNNRKIVCVVPKIYLPTYNEFYENRWFSSGNNIDTKIDIFGNSVPFKSKVIFKNKYNDLCIGTDICEDLWTPEPPSGILAKAGANVIVNLSASNEIIGKNEYRKMLVTSQSGRTVSAYIYVSAGTYESSSDLVFTGETIIAENGNCIISQNQMNQREVICCHTVDLERLMHDRIKMNTYENNMEIDVINIEITDSRTVEYVNPYPFIPSNSNDLSKRCMEILRLQSMGLERRLKSSGIKNMVIGISGGLDSTLALLVCKNVVDRMRLSPKNIIGITMPCFGTTGRTLENSKKLMTALGITSYEIPIKDAVNIHLRDIQHPGDVFDITYENAQARERTQILFDMANHKNGLVIGTGDLSELALGWCTYNGDHMSNYAVNIGVPKTLVKFLVKEYADSFANNNVSQILYDIIDTPISPELLPPDKDGNIEQKTEEKIGKYDIHDFCLYNYVRNGYGEEKVKKLGIIAFQDMVPNNEIIETVNTFFRRFKTQQFKRNCIPDGPKIGSVSLSPRGDWRMPSDL